jgi:hypothetical protein
MLPVDSAPIRADRVFPHRQLTVVRGCPIWVRTRSQRTGGTLTRSMLAHSSNDIRRRSAVQLCRHRYCGVDGRTTAAHTKTRRHGSRVTNRLATSRSGSRLMAESTPTPGRRGARRRPGRRTRRGGSPSWSQAPSAARTWRWPPGDRRAGRGEGEVRELVAVRLALGPGRVQRCRVVPAVVVAVRLNRT